jgi:hypothetical protein
MKNAVSAKPIVLNPIGGRELCDDFTLFACTAKQYPTFWSWLTNRGTGIPAVAKMIERMAA